MIFLEIKNIFLDSGLLRQLNISIQSFVSAFFIVNLLTKDLNIISQEETMLCHLLENNYLYGRQSHNQLILVYINL